MQLSTWPAVFAQGNRVLVIVNGAETRRDEIAATIDAIAAHTPLDAVSAIVPASLRSWFIRRGFAANRVVATELHGVDVELMYFLESPFAIQWAFQQACTLVTGTQPYWPMNEEVKLDFEQRAAVLVGRGRYLVHSRHDERVFLFTPDDIWRRAARPAASQSHVARQQLALSEAHRHWIERGRPVTPAYTPDAARALAALVPAEPHAPEQNAAAVQAAIGAWSRVADALADLTAAVTAPPIQVAPGAARPAAGWIPPHVEAIWESRYVAAAARWEGPRLAMRAQAEGAYSYIFVSAEEDLKRGDAAVATGRVFRGGVTIGLLRNGEWISRVDVDQPGPFTVMVVAEATGDYQFGIANCLRGAETRTAFVLRRFGWTRRER